MTTEPGLGSDLLGWITDTREQVKRLCDLVVRSIEISEE
jgi:hypothetical protein